MSSHFRVAQRSGKNAPAADKDDEILAELESTAFALEQDDRSVSPWNLFSDSTPFDDNASRSSSAFAGVMTTSPFCSPNVASKQVIPVVTVLVTRVYPPFVELRDDKTTEYVSLETFKETEKKKRHDEAVQEHEKRLEIISKMKECIYPARIDLPAVFKGSDWNRIDDHSLLSIMCHEKAESIDIITSYLDKNRKIKLLKEKAAMDQRVVIAAEDELRKWEAFHPSEIISALPTAFKFHCMDFDENQTLSGNSALVTATKTEPAWDQMENTVVTLTNLVVDSCVEGFETRLSFGPETQIATARVEIEWKPDLPKSATERKCWSFAELKDPNAKPLHGLVDVCGIVVKVDETPNSANIVLTDENDEIVEIKFFAFSEQAGVSDCIKKGRVLSCANLNLYHNGPYTTDVLFPTELSLFDLSPRYEHMMPRFKELGQFLKMRRLSS